MLKNGWNILNHDSDWIISSLNMGKDQKPKRYGKWPETYMLIQHCYSIETHNFKILQTRHMQFFWVSNPT